MITRSNSDFCSDCKQGIEEQHPHKRLQVIGEAVFLPGESRTEYTFFQCSICGHIWQHIRDSGLGGHGSFYSILTKGW